MYIYKEAKKIKEDEGTSLYTTVAEIVEAVRESGDDALNKYNVKFGALHSENFRVSESDIKAACDSISKELLETIKLAAKNIKRFAELQADSLLSVGPVETSPGVFLGHKIIPVDSCCCYVPGGSHPLFSSALMLAIPAKVAGVPRVCATVPPMQGSSLPHPATLAALSVAGVDEIYSVGGAQAIAAFAYGTESISPVAMIVGPGNKYVTEAKRQVYGKVGIDFIAGPSEVLIIADEDSRADIIAADLLAQSEHDLDAIGILVTTSEKLAKTVEKEIENQLKELDTAKVASVSWEKNGEIIIAETLEEAAEIANDMAPEHLEINISEPDKIEPLLRNYGSLFIGEGAAEVFGDYVAGTNHTLPTMGAARYTGGVSALTFLKVCTFQRITSEGIKELAPLADIMASSEGLSAHAKAALLRLKK